MAEEKKKSGGGKVFLRGFGLFATITGIILAAVGLALLMTDAEVESNIKYALAIAGLALAFIGAVFVLCGIKKSKAEKEEEQKPIECMYCGESNPPMSKYCRKCGKALVKKCVNCGAVLDMDAKYCNTCGVRVRKDS